MNLFFYLCVLIPSVFFILLGERASISPISYSKGRFRIGSITISYLSFYVICLSLILLCALRPFEDTYDTQVYINWLDEIASSSFLSFSGRFRPGFELLSKVILFVCGSNYRVYFAVIVIVNCLVVFKAIKNINKYSGISFILYIGFLALYYNYIVLRSGLAISFVLLAYSYLDKSRKKALICMIVAVLFHETSLIVFAALILKRFLIPIKKNKLYIILILSIFLYITKIFDQLIYTFVAWLQLYLPASWFHTYILYLDTSDFKNDVSIYYLTCFVLTLVVIYLYRSKQDKYDSFLVINVLGQLGFSLFSSNTITGRLWDYMVPTTFVYLLPLVFEKRKESKFVFLFVFLLGFSLYTRVIVFRLPFYI